MHETWQEAFTDVKAHAKSNTKQLTEIKESLEKIQERQHQQHESLIKIQTVVVDDGFIAAVKDNAEELKHIRDAFQEFQIHRQESCPVKQHEEHRRSWQVNVWRLVFGAVGVLSTFIVIGEKVITVWK